MIKLYPGNTFLLRHFVHPRAVSQGIISLNQITAMNAEVGSMELCEIDALEGWGSGEDEHKESDMCVCGCICELWIMRCQTMNTW